MSLRLWSGLASAARAACAPPLAARANLRSLSTTAQLARLVAPPPPTTAAASPLSKLRFAWPRTPAAAPTASSSTPLASPFSFTSSFFRRAFSSSPARAVRDTYFPRSSRRSSGGGWGGGGGQRRPPSWWRNFRYRLDAISPNGITYALIGINTAVFLLWQYGYSSYQRFQDPSTLIFMTKNFVLSEMNILQGRIWTLITSCFSHQNSTHILFNMLSLYFIAPSVAGLIGTSAFLGLYLGGGIVSSLISLAAKRYYGDKNGTVGASGAVLATLAFFGTIFPRSTFLVFFIVPMPAWALIGGMLAWDLYGTLSHRQTRIDSAGHVGGILAGVLYALRVRRRGVSRGIRW
ncbi:Rhomboid protein 1, mitochondrial [Vanrija pseudolonga]|uniref:Rhomboid protein 1, mitochondrial n=1 Tax=Vanrija pseudolonga TaxID=143232 RepID=A0AAF0Y754_9TREE|nr:Rhomboid protein 1, mitochondrial [Vanrija pseudolonga]